MKRSAQYLDNGFYIISDASARALCAITGRKLPVIGWERAVMLATGAHRLNAWLTRCDLRHSMRTDIEHARGWRWAVKGLRADGPTVINVSNPPITLGAAFEFSPIASTQAAAA